MITKQKFTAPFIILTASAAICTPPSAQAIEVELSGQVNRIIMAIDNGEKDGDGIVHADNSMSGTRWRVKAKTDIGNGISAGIRFENQVQSNRSSKVTLASLDTDGSGGNVGGGDELTIRHGSVWFKGSWGKLTLGQGDGAANGSTEADISATNVADYIGSSKDLLGSIVYGNTTTTVGSARKKYDGLSRNDNVRYDGGSGPFAVAFSLGNGDKIELAGKFKTKNILVRAAIWDEGDSAGAGVDAVGMAVSASWLANSGFNLTGSYNTSEDKNIEEGVNLYLKAGYKINKNAFSISWGQTTLDDLATADPDLESDVVSLSYVNHPMKGVEAYASYRVESLDVSGADDVTALLVGARIKF